MTKTLYFEGAGWAEADSSKATIGNCRIRTAFTNNKGKQIYLEMGCTTKRDKKDFIGYGLRIDHVHYITEDADDCNNSRIIFDYDDLRHNYNYSIEDITKWINKHLDCSFDNIKVLPDLAGYRVHDGKRGHNFADEFHYDKELTAKREEIKKHFYNVEKSEGKQYPNFSLWVDKGDINTLHLLRHFNGYNKHWEIDTSVNNWLDAVKETELGKYAC